MAVPLGYLLQGAVLLVLELIGLHAFYTEANGLLGNEK